MSSLAAESNTVSELVKQLAWAQKSNRGAPAYSRWVNRPAGRLLAALAYKVGLAPNHVTALSATFSFGAIVLVALVNPTVWFGLIIGVMLMLAYALDSADGQLARLRGGGSPTGEWLDHVVDCTKSSAIHMAVLISWYRFFDIEHTSILLIPIFFCLESAVWFFTITLTEKLRQRPKEQAQGAHMEATPSFLRSVLVLPVDYGLLSLSFLMLGTGEVFVWIYAVLMVMNVVFLSAAMPRWYMSLQSTSLHP